MVELENDDIPLKTQVSILSLSRSSLYNQPVEPSDTEMKLKHRIDEIHTSYPTSAGIFKLPAKNIRNDKQLEISQFNAPSCNDTFRVFEHGSPFEKAIELVRVKNEWA
ncbi:hypothetical protein [Alicyclobacillus fastidiosus]|uniref:Uncharacterized protein n=1 Tax=Alicyclobacillus fastidiosus TaxID=392011 RepID=A0ABV5AKT5_9BACL|nr:hypothetical protein [Alicyclobacillus fastidiosus]WEH10264.1 hypothetical protein PYS47_03260 [Alicyclobacillus fastidiosus]